MNERKNSVTFFGNPLTLLGEAPAVGQRAPDFQALDNDLKVKTLKDFVGNVLIVLSVPSLDTPVCDTEARRFNMEATKLGANIRVVVLSMDLPFAQKRWCAAAGIDQVVTLSDHKDADFGLNWGVLVKELRLLTRAVFVVGTDSTVKYVEIVPEATHEPNYEAALSAAKVAG